MKLTWFSVIRFGCIFGILLLLTRNGITYQDLDFWLVIIILLVFGLSEFMEQTIKRYQ